MHVRRWSMHWQDELACYLRAWGRHGVFFALQPSLPAIPVVMRIELAAGWGVPASIPIRRSAPIPSPGAMVYVSHETMVYRFLHSHPERRLRGAINDRFLNPDVWNEDMAPVLRTLEPDIRLVVLGLAPVFAGETMRWSEWVERLSRFLDGLPVSYRYVVDPGTPRFLVPEYASVLRRRGVAHLLDGRDDPGRVLSYLAQPEGDTTDMLVVAVAPEQGKRREAHQAVVAAVRYGMEQRKTVHVCLEQHRAEENVDPRAQAFFLLTVMKRLNDDLARLSPLRRRAA